MFLFTICCESQHISGPFQFLFFPITLKLLKVKCNPIKKNVWPYLLWSRVGVDTEESISLELELVVRLNAFHGYVDKSFHRRQGVLHGENTPCNLRLSIS